MAEQQQETGWSALETALTGVYGAQKPSHWGSAGEWRFAGPVPLRGISAYWNETAPTPHWHFVTFGLTELFEKQSADLARSGFGFELTLRVAPADSERGAPGLGAGPAAEPRRLHRADRAPLRAGAHLQYAGSPHRRASDPAQRAGLRRRSRPAGGERPHRARPLPAGRGAHRRRARRSQGLEHRGPPLAAAREEPAAGDRPDAAEPARRSRDRRAHRSRGGARRARAWAPCSSPVSPGPPECRATTTRSSCRPRRSRT